jgi:hypothetical protein
MPILANDRITNDATVNIGVGGKGHWQGQEVESKGQKVRPSNKGQSKEGEAWLQNG